MNISDNTLMEVNNLKVHFNIKSDNAWPWEKGQALKAVDGINLTIYEGETLGVVGESGCGKSTLARALLRLVPITEGNVVWLGQDLTSLDKKQMRSKRQELQMIFQDPLASLDPRMTVGDIIAEPLNTFKPELSKNEVKAEVNPQHPYTKALLSAVPVPDPKVERGKKIQLLTGDLPSPISPPSGCVFRTRCPHANEGCAQQKPLLQVLSKEHQVACSRLAEIT